MAPELYYDIFECSAAEHITELALKQLVPLPYLEWTTYTCINARVRDYILERRPPNASQVELLVPSL